jgi:hypothetical protein
MTVLFSLASASDSLSAKKAAPSQPAKTEAPALDSKASRPNTAAPSRAKVQVDSGEPGGGTQAKPPDLPAIVKFDDVRCPDAMVGIKPADGKRAFCIDQYEFPNSPGKFPMKERGKRLCADREWMAACKGPDGLKYGYGEKYVADRCVTRNKYFIKVGVRQECRSPYGVYDMIGNVAEWTAGGGVVSFGGQWDSGKSAHCGKWEARQLDQRYNSVGFRCCMDPAKAE